MNKLWKRILPIRPIYFDWNVWTWGHNNFMNDYMAALYLARNGGIPPYKWFPDCTHDFM